MDRFISSFAIERLTVKFRSEKLKGSAPELLKSPKRKEG